MKGVIYARYSAGPRQTDQSIEGQVAECREFAKRNDIQILEVYADRHVSGKSTEGRYEFQRMLRDAEKHLFECVIVWKIDRFGRDRTDIAIAKMQLRKAGIKLMYAAESVPEGPEGIVLESVLEGIAEYYSAELRQKITRGLRETAKKGQHVGSTVPIGYKVVDKKVVPDEKVAPLVKEAFEMYANGAGLMNTLRFLNDHSVKTSRGSAVSQSVLYRMLRNRRYLGIFDQFGVEVRVTPIITPELFKAVSERFPSPRMNASSRATVDYYLSGKAFCANCGSLLIGESGAGRNRVYYYYKCSGKKRNKDCQLRNIPKEELEDLVVKATKEDMLNDDTLKALVDEIMRIQEEESKDTTGPLKKRLKENQKKVDNILSAIEESPSLRSLHDRLAVLEEEQKDLEMRIAEESIKHPILKREVIEAWLSRFKMFGDDRISKELLRTFVSRVEVGDDKLVIYYNSKEAEPKRFDYAPSTPVNVSVTEHTLFYSHGHIVLVVPMTA